MTERKRCGYVGDNGQCLQDAEYDLTIKTDKREWGKLLCEDHVKEEKDTMRHFIRRIAHENIVQETCERMNEIR